MKLNKSTKRALLIVTCVGLAHVGFAFYVFYGMIRGLQFDMASFGMCYQVSADIIDPLESKYRIRECTVGLPSDDTIELRIELNSIDQAQAFDIARDVYELKKKSPVLHKKPLELEIRVRDPKSGVNFHAYMPGAPNHKKKRDIEEYRELTRKWEEIIRQKEMAERRAAEGNEGQ